MKIFINNENIKKLLYTKDYQSINSIINQYLIENNINDDINNFFLDYNGIYLDNNLSLEKYNIHEEYLLNLNIKKKGGNSFFKFAKDNMMLVVIVFLIALLPIFVLPLGFIPLTATLIKIIIEKSTNTIGKYLVCTLGKTTIYRRMKLMIFFIKYIIFILMIFVIITFPLILLCVTLKGQKITNDPKNMCKAISAGNIAGMVLTVVYVMTYMFYRGGNFVLNILINFFKKIYILNMIFNPFLKLILGIYDEAKYMPVAIIPYAGQGIIAYFNFLTNVAPHFEVFLSTVTDYGCKSSFSKEEFMKKMMENVKKNENKNKNETKSESENKKTESPDNELCKDDLLKCCDTKNFVKIGDSVSEIIQNSSTAKLLKSYGVFPIFILFTESLYESALSGINDSENFASKEYEQKRVYLRKLLEEKSDKIPIDLKDSIKKFLENGNNNLVSDIQEKLNKFFPKKDATIINDIKYKIALLEQNMTQYAKDDNSQYIPGANTLFKTIFKIVFVDTFCNVVTTTKTSQDIISKVGEMKEIMDMLKAGTVSGMLIAVYYFITLIVLIICGIFNVF